MEDIPLRRQNLIAGALTDHLTEEEWREFDRARAADPTVNDELEQLREILARLDAAKVAWHEEDLPPGLHDRILAATVMADQTGHAPGAPTHPSSSGRD